MSTYPETITSINNLEDCKSSVQLQVLDEPDRFRLGELYTKYHNRVQVYIISFKIKKTAAECLTQDVFLQLCYDYMNGRKINHYEGYLFGIARNLALGYHRGLNQLPTMSLTDVLENLIILSTTGRTETIQIEDESNKGVSLEVLNEAVNQLPEKYRKALELRYTQNFPVSLAAKHIGCSSNAFYQRVHRAIKMLRANLLSR